ncbi:MAG: efflux RND transporter periplasmic adaptor subunit [Candidatus Krumholzibacteria bacterium]|nr:efflux RND transporter periplasmic adaptor subunit [Candidatus Krumholzibacteria bacterium]MDH4337499.1 efflux RND transporter periplasmic adaptor subunit [Candidatus Krumholzibacteria bacterium]MDH5268314.1 efflux RND transporter periplasmic adaptor subunit [Candidatus Krumholzibacteria bacterium]
MARRIIVTITILVVVIAALAFVKYRQIMAAMEGGAWTPPPEAVTTVVAEEVQWMGTINAVGSVAAVNGVILSADLPGVVQEITFDSGRRVAAGDVLVRLDTSQEQAQLKGAEAQRDLAKLNLDRARDLLTKEAISESDFDRVDAEMRGAEAAVEGYRATIDRKTIRAPFAGILGIRQVNLGQYLAGGDPVVPLQQLEPIYVNFAVPQQDGGRLKPGNDVLARTQSVDGPVAGKITAINSLIDTATRNVDVQATFANRNAALRPGMFVDVEVELGSATSVVTLPASAVSYAPYGNSVYIVEDVTGPDGSTYRGVRQQFVRLGAARGDQVAILSGVNAGEEVVTSGVFKLRPGAAVLVNNEVQPANSQTPNPQDG